MKINGADLTIKLLEDRGIKHIIGIPGGFNLPLYDSLYNSNIEHVLSRHEQGAGFIAQGISRSTGKAAVCFATSGPGVTNLLTAIADAKLDSVPLVAITGQVPFSSIGTDAFQEVDTYGLTVPITKHNFLVRSIEELPSIIQQAFEIAEEGRPGPVLVDIPRDIQVSQIELSSINLRPNSNPILTEVSIDQLKIASALINNSKKPVLYIGGGVISSGASAELLELAEKNNIPVASTLMGLGAFPSDHPLSLKMLGMHGSPSANYLINECDALLAFGVRFDDRAIGKLSKFCPNAKVIHIDIDNAELDKIKCCYVSIKGDIKNVLEKLNPFVETNSRTEWIEKVNSLKIKYPFPLENNKSKFNPINIIKYVGSIIADTSIITTDVGQHQMWVAQAYPFNHPRTLLTSSGLGTMGFGLPAAIGAALANDDKAVICFSGDGSIHMNIQELATLADLNLNVKIIVLNNGHLGMVRQQQEFFFDKHYMASKFKTSVDFSMISRGFGVPGFDLTNSDNPLSDLKNILSSEGPALINIPIPPNENVYPIVPAGLGNIQMIGGDYDVN